MKRKRRWLRVLAWIAGLLAAVLIFAVIDGWRAFGHRATGARRERIEKSPQWQDGHFENPEIIVNDFWGMMSGLLAASPDVSPSSPLPVTPMDPKTLATPPASGLRVTWLGHSTTLIEVDGIRVLTDPSWSERASPMSWIGPKRWYANPIPLDALPAIDAVIVSHDHYDHLDYPTIVALKDRAAKFIVGLGIGAHLEYWGVAPEKIVELDWWEKTKIGDVELACAPARHQSGRFLMQNQTLWASYALLGPKHRVFFSGDTGLFPAMREIGRKLGPFDVTLIEVGQYHGSWPDWHAGPEQAVTAHQMLRGRVLFPMHWGLLTLAYHAWTEPIERVLAAAEKDGTPVVAPRPGQAIEPDDPPAIERWWPKLAIESAEQAPVVSSRVPALPPAKVRELGAGVRARFSEGATAGAPTIVLVGFPDRSVDEVAGPEVRVASLETGVVEDLESVRQAAGADRIHLVAAATASDLASAYAAAHPDRVATLVTALPERCGRRPWALCPETFWPAVTR